MLTQLRPPSGQSSVPRIQAIRSPLTRVGYGLAAGWAHLVLLSSGQARWRAKLDDPDADPALQQECFLWLPDGGGRELVFDGGARGTLLSIPHLALQDALPVSPFGDQMRRTLSQRLALVLKTGMGLDKFATGLAEELAGGRPGAEVAVSHHLSLILLQLWRAARADLVAHGHAPQGLAERFILLANRHRRAQWTVEEYANALEVSRDRLGTAVRRATGLSPKAYLHRGLVQEACQLLADTGMPVAQVGFRLGFSEPGYFSRFFTRMTGVPPSHFRQTARVRRAAGDQSYAAWP